MNFAFYSLWTSSIIAWSRSRVNTRFFWWIGGKEGDTFSLCTMIQVYPRHVFMAPSKYIPVIFKKSCKCLVDHQVSKGTNPGHSIRLGVVEKHLFKPLNRLYHHSVFFYVHGLEVVVHLHHSYVAFARSHLISAQLPYSIIYRELDL